MSNALIVRKIIEDLAKEVHDWDVKSSNMHPSDADGWIGFRKDIEENDEIGDHMTYLNHWDADNTGYLEEEDVKRDNGIGYQMNAVDQITTIK
jgi:hypothetical protein